jgi:hypothetical protein
VYLSAYYISYLSLLATDKTKGRFVMRLLVYHSNVMFFIDLVHLSRFRETYKSFLRICHRVTAELLYALITAL